MMAYDKFKDKSFFERQRIAFLKRALERMGIKILADTKHRGAVFILHICQITILEAVHCTGDWPIILNPVP